MEQIIFTTFPSSCYCSRNFVSRKPISADVPKQLRTFFLFSNPIRRREFVLKRKCSRTYNLRSSSIKAEIQNDAIDKTPLSKRFIIEGVHNYGDIVDGKYRITGLLGQGGASITYEAEVGDGEKVALKAMSLRNMRGWKDLDLFERECRVLQSLKHPNIPQYIDYFEVDTASDRVFYIVQKIANGTSLGNLVESGWCISEEEVKDITLKVLEILQYLGNLRPLVIHRDIKYGYMAPEQFQNRATLQTDLYGLGGTILYMLSGRSPSSFPQKRLKVDFRGFVPMSSNLADIVERLLEPAPEDRFQFAEEVIKALKLEDGSSYDVVSKNDHTRLSSNIKIRQPAGTKVELMRTPSNLKIIIPPGGLTAEIAGTGTFAVAWNAFIAFWTGSAIRMGAPVFFTLFSLPFWFVGIGLAGRAFSSLAISVDLNFGVKEFFITWKLGNLWSYKVGGQTKDILSVGVIIEAEQNGRPVTACCIKEGIKRHTFGAGLELVEKEWLVHEINDFLGLEFPQEDNFLVR